ncbi:MULTISPECIES: DUF6461 domain-containing protein [Amycolatopsis]|uniref:Uncharacterized protein n=1 Tax=Amycolatopsis dendrobii TaxID=2760662 RepID=A0A7W3Z8F5_9PSEU|nr:MULTISPECIES: DUF6461 domain-containing protein [Amycolatopsis]MBB1151619.1 hypothetical protein [Amycolatopsis dendrobii]UKD58169.1 DUF6461 domain-containing protein [Amycolatopsis sp. FU40]
MTNTLNHLAWLENNGPLQDIFCVSFVRRLDPPEVLRRFGADAGEQLAFAELNSRVAEYVGQTQGGNGGGHVGVVSCGEWSVAIEPFGWRGNLPEVIAGLSKESEVVAVNRHDFAEAHFVHAVDGTVMTGFAPRMPSRRYGSEPDRLTPLMRESGLDPGQEERPSHPIAAAFAVAAGMTGVVFTPEFLERTLLVGDIRT